MVAPTTPPVGQSIGAKYDIGFTDASDNFIGLVLDKDRGKPIYQETNDPAVAAQFFTGQVGYANLQPQSELQIGQDDWIKGFGQQYYDSGDTKRYYYTKDADGRFKGRFYAGPKATAVTKPTDAASTPTIANADMELDSDWITESGTWSRNSGQAHGGTYAWRNSSSPGVAYQDMTSGTWVRGAYYVFKCWVWSDVATSARIQINDGVGTTSSAWHTGGSGWEQLSVGRTLALNATQFRLQFDNDSSGNGYFDDASMADTTSIAANVGVTGYFADYNGKLYCNFGKLLAKLNSAGDGFIAVALLPHTISGLVAHVDGNLYIFRSSTATQYYYYMATTEVITITDSVKDFATVVGANMKAVDLPNTVYSAADPTADANWDSGTTIGSSTENINAIVGASGLPYLFKEDFPYYIDDDGEEQRLGAFLLAEKASTSGTNSIEWQGNLYVPCGDQALYEYNIANATWTDISPSKYITNSDDFDGRVQALAADAQYLFAFIDNNTKVELVAGRWETIDSTTSWVWHSLAQLTLAGVNVAHASTVYKRRLWVGSTDSSDSLYYYTLTSLYGNITADTDYLFQTDGEIVTPFHHYNLRGDDKAHVKLTLDMGHTYDANIYFEGWYQMLGGNWTDIGDFKGSSSSMTQTIYLPVETTTSNDPSSVYIRYKFVPKTNDTNKSPELLSYDARAVWFPPHKTFIFARVIVADNLLLANGQVDSEQSSESVRDAINAWDVPSTAWFRAFYPPYWESSSDTIYCKLMPTRGKPFCEAVTNEENKRIGWAYNLTILKGTGITF